MSLTCTFVGLTLPFLQVPHVNPITGTGGLVIVNNPFSKAFSFLVPKWHGEAAIEFEEGNRTGHLDTATFQDGDTDGLMSHLAWSVGN